MLLEKINRTSKQSPKRAGRGISAGRGKTAGRGTKGQRARSGYRRRPGFEGGQTPLMHRLPKLKGFKSLQAPTQTVTLDKLNTLSKKTVTPETLAEANLIEDARGRVKIIGNAKVKKAFNVDVYAVSKNAKAAIEDAGGSVKTTRSA